MDRLIQLANRFEAHDQSIFAIRSQWSSSQVQLQTQRQLSIDSWIYDSRRVKQVTLMDIAQRLITMSRRIASQSNSQQWNVEDRQVYYILSNFREVFVPAFNQSARFFQEHSIQMVSSSSLWTFIAVMSITMMLLIYVLGSLCPSLQLLLRDQSHVVELFLQIPIHVVEAIRARCDTRLITLRGEEDEQLVDDDDLDSVDDMENDNGNDQRKVSTNETSHPNGDDDEPQTISRKSTNAPAAPAVLTRARSHSKLTGSSSKSSLKSNSNRRLLLILLIPLVFLLYAMIISTLVLQPLSQLVFQGVVVLNWTSYLQLATRDALFNLRWLTSPLANASVDVIDVATAHETVIEAVEVYNGTFRSCVILFD